MSKYQSTSVHLLGGCNASPDHLGGVCNPQGQVYDPDSPGSVHQGLYVCDASIIPCSIGVNPALTIATVSEYVSKHLVKDIIGFKREKGTDFPFKSVYQNPCVDNNETKRTNKGNVLIKEVIRGYVGVMPCTAFLKINI
ncbi:hypothetical protein SLEP1_g40509 [Rubroshorea leprosula]|uniref:Cholesterol oxidase n=1 Tax=Rubroshorea leprosula TaxID=152421 RepID=A0AAV5L3L4_9ROSI|nr:hypothetical protein SLEP1_g40509 [Rubroshorea leprosula]